MKRDDEFHGIDTWRRVWVGDNGGHYEWRSTGGRLKAYRVGSCYRCEIDGELVGGVERSLIAAMNAASTLVRKPEGANQWHRTSQTR